MTGAAIARRVLRQLDRRGRARRLAVQCRGESLQRGHRFRQQLTGDRRIAELMGPLAVEPGAGTADVTAGAHPVPALGRRGHVDRLLTRDAPETRERIADDVALDRELARIRDVTEHAAAAERIVEWLAAIGRRFVDGDRFRERDTFRQPFDARADMLARDRASHERDLPVDACDHPAAGRRLLDREGEDLAWYEHRNLELGIRHLEFGIRTAVRGVIPHST